MVSILEPILWRNTVSPLTSLQQFGFRLIGNDDGYYNAAPNTEQDYDLHQYTSQGQLTGFSHYLDLNQLSTLKDQTATYQKLFTVPKESQ